jgi:hypothetical protein
MYENMLSAGDSKDKNIIAGDPTATCTSDPGERSRRKFIKVLIRKMPPTSARNVVGADEMGAGGHAEEPLTPKQAPVRRPPVP